MVVLLSRIGVIALGTVGLTFFNEWIAGLYLLYSVIYNVVIWPAIHCQYCYYKVKQPVAENGNKRIVNDLLPKDEWVKSYLPKHVKCGKRWGMPNLTILWFSPIILIGISLLEDFSIYAVIYLIGFIVMLAIQGIYTRYGICPNCAFVEECHAAFWIKGGTFRKKRERKFVWTVQNSVITENAGLHHCER